MQKTPPKTKKPSSPPPQRYTKKEDIKQSQATYGCVPARSCLTHRARNPPLEPINVLNANRGSLWTAVPGLNLQIEGFTHPTCPFLSCTLPSTQEVKGLSVPSLLRPLGQKHLTGLGSAGGGGAPRARAPLPCPRPNKAPGVRVHSEP